MSRFAATTLVAGWDTFITVANPTATHLESNTTATLSTGATTGGWDDWNNANQGASGDGTFGNLSTSVASASTAYTGGSNSGQNLSLNRLTRGGVLTFTLTNDSGLDRTMDGFYFDAVRRNTQSATGWSLSFSGAISGTAASGAITSVANMNGATSGQRDKVVDLTGLTDGVWEAGTDAIFSLTFSGATGTSGGGGQETLIDNIGITADVVPEPSTTALLGLGGLALILRRRK